MIWLRYLGYKKCLFVCLFVCLFCLFFFYFNHLGTPTEIYPENFVKIRLDLAEIYRILKKVYLFVCLFICLLTCLFFILIFLGHPHKYTLKISRGSDLIWLRYSGSKKCLFVCLFVRLFADLFIFYFNHLGTPTGIYPENFVKIGLDLAEIYRILKKCLFVCLFVCVCVCVFVDVLL